MLSTLDMRLCASIFLVFILSGCAEFNSTPNRATTPYNDPYAQSGIDDLLAFGASIATMSETSRAELCKSLQNTQKISYSEGVQLHLMVGRLLSDDCGDITKILEGVKSLSPSYTADERMQRLIAIDTQTLIRMHNLEKKQRVVLQKPKKSKAVETKNPSEPKQNETNLLREKLEAIRSMEKQMDESIDGN
ncbi:MAG: hypothetical protein PHR94_07900 [Methylomonas lenta]|nr:hypothetical protein [Methylomonas lenta]